MTPTEIKVAVANYLRSKLGKKHIVTLTFSADFAAGNSVSGDIQADGKDYNGNNDIGTPEAIESVLFSTDHLTTIRALARSIQNDPSVLSVQIVSGSSNRSLLITGKNTGETLTLDLSVTGGVSQPTITVATTQLPVWVKVQHENSTKIGEDEETLQKPVYPYATFKVNSVVPQSMGGLHEFDSETDLPLHVQSFEATIVVNYFGNDAFYELQKAHSKLFIVSTSDYFSSLGFGVRNRSVVRDLSGLLETAFEPRSQFEFMLGFQDSWFEDYSTIESAEVTGTIESESGDYVLIDGILTGE